MLTGIYSSGATCAGLVRQRTKYLLSEEVEPFSMMWKCNVSTGFCAADGVPGPKSGKSAFPSVSGTLSGTGILSLWDILRSVPPCQLEWRAEGAYKKSSTCVACRQAVSCDLKSAVHFWFRDLLVLLFLTHLCLYMIVQYIGSH